MDIEELATKLKEINDMSRDAAKNGQWDDDETQGQLNRLENKIQNGLGPDLIIEWSNTYFQFIIRED
jgi:hypothetical protein